MFKLLVIKQDQTTKSGKKYVRYFTIKKDDSIIDVKFKSDVKNIPTETSIIYVDDENFNESVMKNQNGDAKTDKYGNKKKCIWIKEIAKFGTKAEVEKAQEAYKAKQKEQLANDYEQC